jgi:hypothetical protein
MRLSITVSPEIDISQDVTQSQLRPLKGQDLPCLTADYLQLVTTPENTMVESHTVVVPHLVYEY